MGSNRPDSSAESVYELDELVKLKSAIVTAVVGSKADAASANDPSQMLFVPSIYLNSLFNSSVNDPEQEPLEHHQKLLSILSDVKERQHNMFPMTATT